MDIQVNLTPEQINTAVADAIIKSSIGKALQVIIDRKVQELGRSYDNPIEKVVSSFIDDEIRRLITEKYSAQIGKCIAEKMTDELIADLFKKMWETFRSRY